MWAVERKTKSSSPGGVYQHRNSGRVRVSVMNRLLGNGKIFFRDLERHVMKLVIQVHIEAMEQVLRAMD